MSLGLLGSYYSSSSSSDDEDCDKVKQTQNIEESQPEPVPKLANPFMKSASRSLKPSYMVETEDLSASKQVI